jgi:GNAT superfamily N-acetyltransferase
MDRLPKVAVRRAVPDDLDRLTPLFDAYRQFYRLPSDPEGARRFLRERFTHSDSAIFLAFDGLAAVGFTQLYPTFSSGAMAWIFILNDLFVVPAARKRGAGTALLNAAAEFGRNEGALRLVLRTEHTNTTAQSLYERAGWIQDTDFRTNNLAL